MNRKQIVHFVTNKLKANSLLGNKQTENKYLFKRKVNLGAQDSIVPFTKM